MEAVWANSFADSPQYEKVTSLMDYVIDVWTEGLMKCAIILAMTVGDKWPFRRMEPKHKANRPGESIERMKCHSMVE